MYVLISCSHAPAMTSYLMVLVVLTSSKSAHALLSSSTLRRNEKIRNVHSETPRKFRCSKCDASYDSFGAKTRHEHATHNTDSPEFVCTFPDCSRAFNFPAHLESHALHYHPGFRPFGCTECSKRFNSANGLIRHKREVHRRNRAYSCSCGTTFAKKGACRSERCVCGRRPAGSE